MLKISIKKSLDFHWRTQRLEAKFQEEIERRKKFNSIDKDNEEKIKQLSALKQNIEKFTEENKKFTEILIRKDFYREYEFMRKEVNYNF